LLRLETVTFESFKLNANRKVVAVGVLFKDRHAGVPGAVVTAYELPQLTISANIEVGRHL
jgi:hypothetical protein